MTLADRSSSTESEEGVESPGFAGDLIAAGFAQAAVRRVGIGRIHWLSVGDAVVDQGWKLHVSARSDGVGSLIQRAAPVLQRFGLPFKVVATEAVAIALNSGDEGAWSIGKILTVYPDNDEVAVAAAESLIRLLSGFEAPIIESELRLSSRAPVYARYGAFRRRKVMTPLGLAIDVIKSADGTDIRDVRGAPMHDLAGVANIFPEAVWSEAPALYGERFLALGLLRQPRHRAVALAVDLESGQQCVLKTARKHAALDRRGMDAADRLDHEWDFLVQLTGSRRVPAAIARLNDDSWRTLVSEHVEGQSLPEVLQQANGDVGKQAALVSELIRLVSDLHSAGVIIVDLSPDNVVIDGAGRAHLVDLELATVVGDDCLSPRAGTRGFTAPALLRGQAPAPEHDLHSLAAIVFLVASGINLSTIPNHEALLASGDGLESPWGEIVALLLSGTVRTGSTLAACLKLLRPTAVSRRRPAKRPADAAGDDEGLISRGPGLASALAIAESIVRQGTWSESEEPVWTSLHPSMHGERRRDFYSGDAGISFALARIGLATSRLDLVDAAITAARRLVRLPVDDPVLPGLLIGQAGVGLLCLHLYEITGEAGWLDHAVEVARAVHRLESPSPDLVHGNAGRGLFYIWLHQASQEREHIRWAIDVATELAATAERAEGATLWPIPDGFGGLSNQRLFGLAHGSAGVAYFLAELAAVHPDGWERDLLTSAAKGLTTAGQAVGPHSPMVWLDAPGGRERGGVWCHGAAGIALAFMRVHEVESEAESLHLAQDAVESAIRHAHRLDPTQCHGLAGLLEVVLSFWTISKEPRYLAVANWLGDRLLRLYQVSEGNETFVCSEAPNVLTPDFMVGASGAVAALARLAAPERFDHFLAAPARAFRPLVPACP